MALSTSTTAVSLRRRRNWALPAFLHSRGADLRDLLTNHAGFATERMEVYMLPTGNSHGERAPMARQMLAKLVLDLLIAGTLLVMFSPLLVLICLGIKLQDRSQEILVRRRAGFNGHEFAICRFPITASTHELSRVTRLGHLLQGTNLDELPELFNVLGGQMSMVGPRPHVADPEWNSDKPMHRGTQHYIKPGITGWAQINWFQCKTPRADQVNRSIDVERWYINNWSIWLDLRILLRAMVYSA